eukprot:COSAG01_NODE_782_length_13631_cov_73.763450_14_plen_136_part_00
MATHRVETNKDTPSGSLARISACSSLVGGSTPVVPPPAADSGVPKMKSILVETQGNLSHCLGAEPDSWTAPVHPPPPAAAAAAAAPGRLAALDMRTCSVTSLSGPVLKNVGKSQPVQNSGPNNYSFSGPDCQNRR